jgi:deoxyribodipyrimidine photo-lyase
MAVPPADSAYVFYWMQQAQRTYCNHALCYAAEKASDLRLPLVVGFVLDSGFPGARFRHYRFMLQGLEQVRQALADLNITFVLKTGQMVAGVADMADRAAWVVTDAGYLRIQRQWRKQIAGRLNCPFTIVETDVVVPVSMVSEKTEFAARTIRPKIMKKINDFLKYPEEPEQMPANKGLPFDHEPVIDPEFYCSKIGCDKKDKGDNNLIFRGGQDNARLLLSDFVEEKLSDYPRLAKDPSAQCQSDLSPYLHFGQISPVDIALRVNNSDAPAEAKQAFIEQLVVRRELAVNFVFHTPDYDTYESAVPAWAKKTLGEHEKDKRLWYYNPAELENSQTHDPYWNAAQAEMVNTGKMHNYMRMYWGKKIIEWSHTPKQAFETMIYLNNRYELDGRDPNGFAGIAWCFGLHDRPWKERSVFGKIRYMNAAGLERKFDISSYVKQNNY